MIWLFSLIPIHHAKNRKAYQGSLQVSSTNESGVRALALPLTWVLLGTCRQREESPASALPYCFSVFCFLGTAFSSVYHRPIVEEGRIEKWNSLMILHSPALLLTADVEDGRLEIGFIVSWGLFIPLLLISQRVRFLDPLKEKILKIYFSVPQCFPRNDRILMVLSAHQSKIFKEGCEKGVLMQYKCMEKEIRKLHGRILFPSVMYIAIIPAGMQLWQKGHHESLYRLLIFLPDFPGKIGTNSADS